MIHFTAAPILRIPRRRDRPFRMHTITDADGPRLVVAGWRPLTTLADATRAYIDAARSERTRDVYRAQWATVTARLGRQGRVSARCRQRPRLSRCTRPHVPKPVARSRHSRSRWRPSRKRINSAATSRPADRRSFDRYSAAST